MLALLQQRTNAPETTHTASPTTRPEPAVLSLEVREPDGSAPAERVWVRLSGSEEEEEITGGQLLLEVPEGEWTFWLETPTRKTDPMSLSIRAGDILSLQLQLPPPIASRMASGLYLTREGGIWRIEAVEPGSPAAAAGLTPGDEITAIGGIPVPTLSPTQILSIHTGYPGEILSLDGMTLDAQGQPVPFQTDLLLPAYP